MDVKVIKSRVTGLKVTKAKHDYGLAIVIEGNLASAAGLLPYEFAFVLNKRTKSMIQMPILFGEPDKGEVGVNYMPWNIGDEIEIYAYAMIPRDFAMTFQPKSVEAINNQLPKSNLKVAKNKIIAP